MAAYMVSRICRARFLNNIPQITVQKVNGLSTAGLLPKGNKKWWIGVGMFASLTGGVVYAVGSIDASDLKAVPTTLPWFHNTSFFHGYDHGSMRRGYEVYKQVCASCHSLQYLSYRHLINQTHTEDQAKAEAEEATVEDGPDDEGKMFTRPGKLTDYFTGPYKNENEARFANNGALPPDLSLIVLARKGGEDYIFHLLTNYTDPPAGITVEEGQSYNPYFPGGGIGMPQVIFDGIVDFSDGTPASAPQMAKDVTTFLAWVADPNLETRKKFGLKAIPFLTILFVLSWYHYRSRVAVYKTTKYQFVPRIRK